MKHATYNKSIFSVLAFLLLLTSSIFVMAYNTSGDNKDSKDIKNISIMSAELPDAIAISDNNPFFALIATPIAVNYNEEGDQSIIPLYIKDFENPSSAIIRAEQDIGIYANYVIDDIYTPKEISLSAAEQFWTQSSAALIIKDDDTGYQLGVVAAPISSYLSIPVIVTDDIDSQVTDVLDYLGVQDLYICGDLGNPSYNVIQLTSVEQINSIILDIISDKFGTSANYITLSNPMDVKKPEVLDSVTYDFSDTIGSGIFLPTQSFNVLLNSAFGFHEFEVPEDYKYANLKITLDNLNIGHVESLGDRMTFLLFGPDGETRHLFASTAGGIAERDSEGNVVRDVIEVEITLYDNPGTYTLQVFSQWFASKEGDYNVEVTVEKLDNPFYPLMDNISSIAPYLTAYHKGIVFAKPEFAFAADDDVIFNNSTCPGLTQPGMNYKLIEPSNNHTMNIHDELNDLIADIVGISVENLEQLRNYCSDNPLYIAIAADPTMVPMYFYYNPDGLPDSPAADFLGFSLPSDFIYGDVDVDHSDPENDTFTYWPFQENVVSRVTGRDIQDCSALLARTFFYDLIINDMGDWKDNALVQTGCGLEFQNLPIITRLSQLLYSGRGEPTKFPTGESRFINMKLKDQMETGYTNVNSTYLLQSQRVGFSEEALNEIKKLGPLNMLLFPKNLVEFLSSEDKVIGGQSQLNSNLIFSFAHGSYNLFEHGDVFIDSRGFPGITTFSRIYPKFRSSLSNLGTFDIRSVENMEYGPSVIYVESCITARTDGLEGKNVLSQAFIHAGVNTYIGATRVTADPGYLEPRPLPNGWGIGLLGLTKTVLDYKLKGEYPELHFGAVVAEDFVTDLIENNSDVGTALRNAKNQYLPKDANTTFLWTPPLTLSLTGIPSLDQDINEKINPIQQNERTRVLDKKYVCLHEFALYGDPAFNPYQSINEG